MKIITPIQEKFLKAFFVSPLATSFFLTGGTALTEYYLRHRKSEDLDLFTLDQKLKFDFVNAEVLKIARNLDFKIINQVSTGTYLQFILKSDSEILKVDLVKDVPVQFGKVKNVKGVFVDSIENIAVNKLLAIFGRTDAKDFIDFYFLLKEKKFNFSDIFDKAKKKDTGLSEFYLASMLGEVENLNVFPRVLKTYNKQEFNKFFSELSKQLFEKIRPQQ